MLPPVRQRSISSASKRTSPGQRTAQLPNLPRRRFNAHGTRVATALRGAAHGLGVPRVAPVQGGATHVEWIKGLGRDRGPPVGKEGEPGAAMKTVLLLLGRTQTRVIAVVRFVQDWMDITKLI